MRLTDYISEPTVSYIRVGKPYPNFWGESHTHPNLVSLNGENISCAIYCYYKGTAYYLVDKKDFAKVKQVLFKKLLSKPNHITYCLKKTKEAISKTELYFEPIISNLNKISDEELSEVVKILHHQFFKVQFYADTTYYMSESILNHEFISKLDSYLSKRLYDKYEIINTLTAFDSLSFLKREELSLAKIAKSRNRTLLYQHISAWRHKTFDYWGPITSDEEFYARYNMFKEQPLKTEKLIEKHESYFKNHKKRRSNLIKRYNLPKSITSLAMLISQVGFLNDTKKYGVTRLSYFLDLLLDEVSSRFDIEKEMLYYLFPIEMENLKRNEVESLKVELSKRMKWFVIVFQSGEYKTFFTKSDIPISRDVKKIISQQNQNKYRKRIICSGVTASNGEYDGIVVKMFSYKDISKAKKGMVLVSPKTTVDFIVALHKAGAVVTDYGGLTSHSAVVSREMNIPCVVGTMNATKIFLDGDRVHIDGKSGKITLIKRNIS